VATLSQPIVVPTNHGRVLSDPEWQDWLAERGYLSGVPHAAAPRTVFFRSARRENARRDDGPDGGILYDKVLRGRRDKNAAIHEWEMLRRALSAGVHVPRPICAASVKSDDDHAASLVTMELVGGALADLVRQPLIDLPSRRVLAHSVGSAIARLHAAGITFPSLFAKHVIVDNDGRIGFLDLADAEPRVPKRADRARDLAALGSTLPRWPVSRGLRLIALRAYLETSGISWRPREAWRAISRAIDRRMRRRRYRIHLAGTPTRPCSTVAPSPDTRVISEESNALERHGGLEKLQLAGLQWSSVDDLVVMRSTRERTIRTWHILELLRAFDIPAPRSVAMRFDGNLGVLLRRDTPPSDAAPCTDARLSNVIGKLFRAGLTPTAGLADALVVDGNDVVHVLEPALDQPAVVHKRRQVRRFRTLTNALVARGMEPTIAARLCQSLQ